VTQLTIPRSEHMTGARYAKLRRSGYHRMVDSTVTVRMIRALRRIGYSNRAIAAGTGLAHPNVIGNLANETNPGTRTKVFVETAEAVADFYWRHHNKPRTDADGRRMATWAARRGWASPMAYEDITDLSERPKGVLKA
jgi:hypothetical protein